VRRWEDIIVRAADRTRLDPNLLAALMMTESEGNPDAVSPKGAIGLLQVMGGPTDPAANVQQGADILAGHVAHYGGKLDLALAAYNAGPGAVDRYGGVPPYLETRDHVFRVLLRYDLYRGRR
jgi:soluble lytic murein transglycosylase-like protein